MPDDDGQPVTGQDGDDLEETLPAGRVQRAGIAPAGRAEVCAARDGRLLAPTMVVQPVRRRVEPNVTSVTRTAKREGKHFRLWASRRRVRSVGEKGRRVMKTKELVAEVPVAVQCDTTLSDAAERMSSANLGVCWFWTAPGWSGSSPTGTSS